MSLNGVVPLVIRLTGGIASVACFVTGLYSVFSRPARGFALIGLALVLAVIFGRVPARARETDKKTDAA